MQASVVMGVQLVFFNQNTDIPAIYLLFKNNYKCTYFHISETGDQVSAFMVSPMQHAGLCTDAADTAPGLWVGRQSSLSSVHAAGTDMDV